MTKTTTCNNLRFIMAAVTATMICVMTSCHAPKRVVATDGIPVATVDKKASSASSAQSATESHPESIYSKVDRAKLDATTARLFDEADTWRGVPYKWGGNTRDGVDCSGFVLQVYNTAVGIPLPRVSAQQYEYCTPVNKSNIAPGDLVFFETNPNKAGISHVGIYIGNGHMIHASSKRGVIVTNINSDYYTKHYYGAGRIERFHAMKKQAAATKK